MGEDRFHNFGMLPFCELHRLIVWGAPPVRHFAILIALAICACAAPRAVAQSATAVERERNACIAAASKKYERKAEGAVASYAIWRAELQQCDDLMLSRLTAQQMRGADCSLKLDWMLRYQMRVTSPGQKGMAEDRYAEICGRR
jgi:hypothetical protein